ncbi:protein FAM217B [Astyanax mexicanus]|uniref:Protein FAM217B-like n=1 Tax=Astyanax mexicanus TaxID=7994 RepID=A0A8T2KP19_ASTMX|nr:protein FAM217B [Astyanax mexicanus]KAG9260289.1 protein FAM217B-like [Astyanax mexicanus]
MRINGGFSSSSAAEANTPGAQRGAAVGGAGGMGTVLQERPMQNSHNQPAAKTRAKPKDPAPALRRSTSSAGHSSRAEKKEDHMAIENGLQVRGRRTRCDRASIMVTATALNPREHITKPKSHTSSTNGPRERRHRRNTRRGSDKDSGDSGKLPTSLPHSLTSVSAPRQGLAKQETQNETTARLHEPRAEDTDSDSDLSDTERLPGPPSITAPPELHLRAEEINPCDIRPSRAAHRSRSSDGYPDFLPPPFNSWSLQQLAVYLNTDGRGASRPRPVGQLERYLERLLQLEWRQIQTVHEESNKAIPFSWASCHRPHTSPHSNLSAPKSILQCQRAFPLALLSSLAKAPPLQPPTCTCPSCRKNYPICNGACRLYTHPHHSHLSPLPEKRGKAPGVPRRSSSESRAQQFQRKPGPRNHRLSDPLDNTSYLKRMQAIGNIRNPAGGPCVESSMEVGALRKKGTGERSQSCGDVREDSYRRARVERKTSTQHIRQDSKSSGATSSDDLHSSKDSVTGRTAGKQKRVEFIT